MYQDGVYECIGVTEYECIRMEAMKHDKATHPRYPTCSQMINTAYCILHIRPRHLYIQPQALMQKHPTEVNAQKRCMSHTLVALADIDVTELVSVDECMKVDPPNCQDRSSQCYAVSKAQEIILCYTSMLLDFMKCLK